MSATVISRPDTSTRTGDPSGDAVRRRLRAGGSVVLARPGAPALLVCAAHSASTRETAFMVRHTSGFLTLALPLARCEALDLPPMDPFHTSGSRMCVGVDAVLGTGTGISAADRATTARALLDDRAEAGWFTRPGHLVPIAVDSVDPAASAAAAALASVVDAGLPAGALFAALVGDADDTATMTDGEAAAFAGAHDLPLTFGLDRHRLRADRGASVRTPRARVGGE